YQKAKIIPEFAACLATSPNLDTIEVIYAEWEMQTDVKNAFRCKRFPSVQRISLPSFAHEIIRGCRNLEEVTCVDGGGSKIVQTLVEGKCHQVRILKGISAPLTQLVNLVPNLTHASVVPKVNEPFSVSLTSLHSRTSLTSFPFLDTIEILVNYYVRWFSEFAALDIKVREILKGNKSQAQKTVVLTKSNNCWDYRAYEYDI
ncbi:hypothetical protein EV363DRAFT_1134803, partial [Boletus edulis]